MNFQLIKAVIRYNARKVLPIISNLIQRQSSRQSLPRQTLSQQASLPRLPVPPLQTTMEKYLRFVQPLLSADDFEYTKNLVDQFMKTRGPILHERLVERSKKMENWLAEWWLNVAYLEYRSPIVVNVNPGLRLPLETFKNEDEWLAFTAKFICGVLDIKQLIDEQRLPVDMMGKNPLCMIQYYSVLSSCRVPGMRLDKVKNFSNAEGRTPGHICVMHNNRIFVVDLYDENGNPFNVSQIFQQLKRVVAQSHIRGPPIGLLTAENRNVWGTAYKRLRTHAGNVENFEFIHSSIFFMCLDQPFLEGVAEEKYDSAVAKNMLHGGGYKGNSSNRWFDKTIQFIVSRDGACGFNYEHSPAEGPPVVSIVDHVYKYMKENANALVPEEVVTELPYPQELKFMIDPETKSDLNMAKTNIASLVHDLQLTAFTNHEFGKVYAKENRLSPDGFIQMAFQLAYYRMYGVPCATYESGSTRRFALGRTDTIRSCGPLSVAFTKAMTDSECTIDEKADALRAAVKEHSRHTGEVLSGSGIDRHLLGLKLIAVESGEDIPEIFMDNAYNKALHFNLSTSQVPSKVDSSLCFGPVVPDGYGVCYNPQSNRVHIVVTAYFASPETDSDRFAEELKKAFRDMQTVTDKSIVKPRL